MSENKPKGTGEVKYQPFKSWGHTLRMNKGPLGFGLIMAAGIVYLVYTTPPGENMSDQFAKKSRDDDMEKRNQG